MSFVSDLITWFISGRTAGDDGPDTASEHKHSTEPEPTPAENGSKHADLSLADSRDAILIELGKIGSISKQFDSARDEMVRELRNISPDRKTIRRLHEPR